MKINCKIIEDLLPLYADKICSEESRKTVEEHCRSCAPCREKLDAMSISLPEDKAEGSPQNPMKKVRRHFIKVAVTTFMLCLLAFPLYGIIILDSNDAAYHYPSWTSISADRKIKKLAEDIQKGNAEEAFLDIAVRGRDMRIYDTENAEGLIRSYAAVFGNFFSKYPVESYYFNAGYSNVNYDGSLNLNLDKAYTDNIRFYLQINYYSDGGRIYMKDAMLICDSGEYSYFDTPKYYDISKKLSQDLPYINYPGVSVAENLENCFKGDYNAVSSAVITKKYAEIVQREWSITAEYEKLKTVEKEQYTDIDEIVRERRDYKDKMGNDLEKLCSDYTFSHAYYTPPAYNADRFMADYDMAAANCCYSQYMELVFSDKDGKEFKVRIFAKINSAFEAPFANISYSDGTPRDFKIAFEEIFM
ncbi:MAG: zf-HC2 domain-containing protein [Ruminococcus sp.]|nr:zf-HC2 domain-containing protein [Ruminococcus sp.]